MKDNKRLFLVGLLVTLIVAVIVAQFASSSPDGLEHVADQQGFANTATDHNLANAPLADYGDGLSNSGTLNTAVAGAVGVVITLVVGYGVFWLARKTNKTPHESA
jgi:ABC-type spermidine/putrescine transport system permease subunit I